MMGLIRALLSFLVFVHLTGPVVAATTVNTPQLDGLPASLNFLPVSLINSERSIYYHQTLTLTNTGTAALVIDNILTTGDFLQSNNCGSGLGVGEQCQVTVSYRPTDGGTPNGALSIASNATNSPHQVALSGTPTDFETVVIYSDNGDGTVTDPKTGLTWMRCLMGQAWDGSTCTGDAKSYSWAQAKALAGQDGWRLPTVRELTTIRFTGIMFHYSTALSTSGDLWSGSPSASDPDLAWVVHSSSTALRNTNDPNSNYRVRMVRGAESSPVLSLARPTGDYVDHGDGTVTHTPTGLTWKRCAEGQTWSNGACTGTATVLTRWQADLFRFNTDTFAGHNDWRLPALDELESLVDYTKASPALNNTVFSAAPSLWTSLVDGSGYKTYPVGAWMIGFDNAGALSSVALEYQSVGVRLVRGQQSFMQQWPLSVKISGAGTVSSSFGGVDCSTACTNNFIQGTKVILTATPAQNLIGWGGVCTGRATTCTVTLDEAKTTVANFSDASKAPATFLLKQGWNLLGNGFNTPLDVATIFGNAAQVNTVWKWVPNWKSDWTTYIDKWAFFMPNSGITTDFGAAYATSKAYLPLTTIEAGEGFWVNAKTDWTVQLPVGTRVSSSQFTSLIGNWNLIAIGDYKTPREFTPTNINTLWTWNSAVQKWYFYAPSLDSAGTLQSYITDKGYLDFGSDMLLPTTGFWVNKP